jgi:hypothetical protein
MTRLSIIRLSIISVLVLALGLLAAAEYVETSNPVSSSDTGLL